MRDVDGFKRELAALLNRHGADNDTNTCDFILAAYLTTALHNFKMTMQERMSLATPAAPAPATCTDCGKLYIDHAPTGLGHPFNTAPAPDPAVPCITCCGSGWVYEYNESGVALDLSANAIDRFDQAARRCRWVGPVAAVELDGGLVPLPWRLMDIAGREIARGGREHMTTLEELLNSLRGYRALFEAHVPRVGELAEYLGFDAAEERPTAERLIQRASDLRQQWDDTLRSIASARALLIAMYREACALNALAPPGRIAEAQAAHDRFEALYKAADSALAVRPEPDPAVRGDCIPCAEEDQARCEKSNRGCGHHCNHTWTHDGCCWCGWQVVEEPAQGGEEGER